MSANKNCISCLLNHCCHACICCECPRDCKYCHDTLKVKGRTERCLFIDIDNGTGLKYRKDEKTMTKQELERRLESAEKQMLGLQDEIKNLKERLSEVEQEREIPEFPVFGEKEMAYYVSSFLDIRRGFTDVPEDYNAFHTEEMAQEFADKCKLIAMMLHCKHYLCPDYAPDFTCTNSKNWYVFYNTLSKSYDYISSGSFDRNTVYFDTAENAKKCADWLNERMKKGETDS